MIIIKKKRTKQLVCGKVVFMSIKWLDFYDDYIIPIVMSLTLRVQPMFLKNGGGKNFIRDVDGGFKEHTYLMTSKICSVREKPKLLEAVGYCFYD